MNNINQSAEVLFTRSRDPIFKTRKISQSVTRSMEGHPLNTSVSNRTMNIHDCPKINPQKITFLTMLLLLKLTAM